MSKNKGKISKVIVQLFLNTHLVIDHVYTGMYTQCICVNVSPHVHLSMYMLQSLNIEVL